MVRGEGEDAPGDGFPSAITSRFARVREAVDSLCRRPDEAFLAHQIGEQMEHLAQSRDMLDREFARLAGVFARTHEAERQGSNGDVEWIRHHCRMSLSDAAERLVVGEQLSRLSLSSCALDTGELGFGHLVHMARNARFCENSPTGHFDERPLLERARQESVSRFRHTCLSARHAQDPEGYARSETNAVESRELLFYNQDDGMTFISARLDPTAPPPCRPRSRRWPGALIPMTIAPPPAGTPTRLSRWRSTCSTTVPFPRPAAGVPTSM